MLLRKYAMLHDRRTASYDNSYFPTCSKLSPALRQLAMLLCHHRIHGDFSSHWERAPRPPFPLSNRHTSTDRQQLSELTTSTRGFDPLIWIRPRGTVRKCNNLKARINHARTGTNRSALWASLSSWLASRSVLTGGPKCTLATSHAAPGESRWLCQRDRQTDWRTPDRYVMLSAMEVASVKSKQRPATQ